MKAFFSIILAIPIAVSVGSVQAGPVHTAANVAKSTAQTAKNVGHSVVKGTKRAMHTVVDTNAFPVTVMTGVRLTFSVWQSGREKGISSV